MSILWVEDFEYEKYKEFTEAIFGELFELSGKRLNMDNLITKPGLKAELRKHGVFVETTFRDAISFINTKLFDVDFVILDIDLPIAGEEVDLDNLEESLGKETLTILKTWHGFDMDPIRLETTYSVSIEEMKKIAGYHLFISLVLDKRFPREHILFCSNHGSYLNDIPESFKSAKINPPKIYTKSDRDGSDGIYSWLRERVNDDRYIKLRRWVINACRHFTDKIEIDDKNDQQKVMKGLDATQIQVVLESLPYILPEHGLEEHAKSKVYRRFVSLLVEPFDEKIDDKLIKSYHYDTIPWPVASYYWTLKNCRNWGSHDCRSFTSMDEGDVAFLFILALRFFFYPKKNSPSYYEEELLPLIGDSIKLDQNKIEKSFNTVKNKAMADYRDYFKKTHASFTYVTNALFRSNKRPAEEATCLIYQIFWDNINYKENKGSAPLMRWIENDKLIKELASRTFCKAYKLGNYSGQPR